MPKNRKYQPASIRFGQALKVCLLCLFIGGSGIGYVWQKNQIYELGQQMRRRESRVEDLREQNDKLKKQLATLLSPRFLDQRARELNLGLGAPQPSQVVRLTEPQSGAPAAMPQLAAGQWLDPEP